MSQELPDVLNQKRRAALRGLGTRDRGARVAGRCRRAAGRGGQRSAKFALISCLLLCTSQATAGKTNVVSKIDVEERGSQTVVTVHGSGRPVFSVFKLERPPRLTIDLANCRLSGGSQLVEADSWGVNQVAANAFRSASASIVRVMINFRRRAHYDVRTVGNALVAVITPHEPKPALPKEVSAELAAARQTAHRAQQEAHAAVARHRAELAKREELAQRYRAEAERLRADVSAARQAAGAKARQQRERAEQQLQRAEQRAQLAKQERERVAQLLAAAEARGERAEAARIAAERRRDEADRARQQTEARALKRERAQAAQVAAAQAKLAALQKQAASSAEEKKQLATAVAQSKRLHGELQTQLARLREDLRRQRDLAARAQRDTEARRRDARAARERVARERESAAKQRAAAALAAAEERLVAARQERERLAREREKLTAEVQGVEQRRRGVMAALPRLQKQLAEAARRLPEAEARLARAQRGLQASEQQLARVARERALEEARHHKAAAARKDEERRLRDVEQQRIAVEKAKAAAERDLREARRGLKRARHAAAAKRAQRKAEREQLVRVRDVRFVDRADRVRVELELDGTAAHRLTAAGGDPVLSLARARLPRRLQRTLDTSAFDGPVTSVSSYDDGDRGTVSVKVALKGSPQQRVVREGSTLVWEFAKPTLARATRVVDPPKDGAREYGATKVAGVRKGAPSMRRRRYVGRRIDLDFKDADIHNILRLLSDVGNVNIITSDAVGGSVTIRMKNVPWDHALDVILRAKGLGMVREGNLLRVAPLADLEKEREAELARQKQVVLLQPLETRLIPLSYAQAQEVLPQLQYTLSPRGKLTFDPRTNMIIARDIVSNLNVVQQMVRNLDTQTPQVLIEARIVEARTNYSKQLGIQWGGAFTATAANGNSTGLVFPNEIGIGGGTDDPQAPTGGLLLGQDANPNFLVNMPASTGLNSGAAIGLSLGSLSGAFNVSLRLSAAEATGDIRIISSPRITTLDNVEAKISQGVTIPFAQVSANGVQTTFKDARLDLSVKPHVTADGSIIMKIQIMRNEPDFVNTGPRGDPTILTKEANTEMLVKDGMTAVIGGIYTTRDGRSWNKVPWLAEIPILGWFFKNRRENSDREEVLVFITPRIINRAESIGE